MASLCAADGRNLVLVARNAERLCRVAEELRTEHGVRAVALPMDLAAPGAAERLYSETQERGIEVEFLANNAGFGMSRRFSDVPLQVQETMIGLNLAALASLCHLYLPGMLERGRGRILNVGSGAGYVPGLGFTTYAATKAFVLHLTEGLAGELGGTGVTASVLCPGPVDTPFLGTAGIAGFSGVRRLALADPRKVALGRATGGRCGARS